MCVLSASKLLTLDTSYKRDFVLETACAVYKYNRNKIKKEYQLAFGRKQNKPQIEAAQAKLDAGEELGSLLDGIRELSIHYAKKGDLLYPLLKVKYEISGPSDVMWTVDDEIRDELSELANDMIPGDEMKRRMEAVLERAKEMIYKENNILFPICAVNFSEDEWHGIYHDAKDYNDCVGVTPYTWEEAECAGIPSARAAGNASVNSHWIGRASCRERV